MLLFIWIFLPLVALLGVVSLGMALWRWVFPDSEKEFLLSGGVMLGAAVASVWLANAGRYMGWSFARWSLLGIGLLSTLFVTHFFPSWGTRSLTRVWKRNVSLLGIGLFILSLSGGIFDETGHFSFASTLANGVWLDTFSFNPSIVFTYHFGFDILVAQLVSFGWPVALASDVWQAILQLSLITLVWQFFVSAGLTSFRAAWGSLILFFVGTVGWLLKPFQRFWKEVIGQQILTFHGSLWNPIFLVTYAKSTIVALGLLVIWLLVLSQRPRIRTTALFCLLPVCLAAVAISSETIFLGILPFLFLGHLFSQISWRQRAVIVLMGGLGLLLSVSSGGLIRDAFTALFTQRATVDQVNQAGFSLRRTDFLQTFGYPLSLFSVLGWLRLCVELGAISFLAWHGLRSYRAQFLPVRWMIVAACVCIILPFVLVYPVKEREFLRLWLPGFFLLALVGIPLFFEASWSWLKRGFIGASVMGGIAAALLSNLPFGYWLASKNPVVYHPAFWSAALDPTQKLSPQSVIWMNAEKAPDLDVYFSSLYQVPVVFGVPVQTCFDFFVRKVSDRCEAFQAAPTLEGLRNLQVSHVLLSDSFIQRHRDGSWFAHISEVQRYTPPRWMYWLPSAWWKGRETDSFVLFRVL